MSETTLHERVLSNIWDHSVEAIGAALTLLIVVIIERFGGHEIDSSFRLLAEGLFLWVTLTAITIRIQAHNTQEDLQKKLASLAANIDTIEERVQELPVQLVRNLKEMPMIEPEGAVLNNLKTRIQSMKADQVVRATQHLTKVEQATVWTDKDEVIEYFNVQTAALKRGVQIKRLFIVIREVSGDYEARREYINLIEQNVKAGIDVRILQASGRLDETPMTTSCSSRLAFR